MKKALGIFLTVILLLFTTCDKQGENGIFAVKDTYTIKASQQGVSDFLKLHTDFHSPYSDDACYNITPDFVSEHSGFQVFKYKLSCDTFLVYKGAVYTMGTAFGGSGVTSMALADMNKDGQKELYFTYSWGSGLHRSQVGYFDPALTPQSVVPFQATFLNQDVLLTTQNNRLYVDIAAVTGDNFVQLQLTSKGHTAEILRKDGVIQLLKTAG